MGSLRGLSDIQKEVRILKEATEQSPATVVITDLAGNIEYVNRKFVELTGYSFEEAIGKNPRILKSGQTPDSVYKDLWRTILSGREWHGTFKNKTKNGDFYWEAASIAPIVGDDGTITNFIAVKEDITGRKEIEYNLNERLKELRGIAAVRSELQKDLSVEDFCCRIIDHIIPAMQFPDLTVPVITLAGVRYAQDENEMTNGEVLQADITVQGKSFGVLKVGYKEKRGFSLPEEQNFIDIVAQSIGIFIERKTADEKLRESRDRYELIFNASPDMILLARLSDSHIVESNLKFHEMSGYSKEETIGKTTIELGIWDNVDDRIKVLQDLQEKSVSNGRELRFKKKNGDVIIGLIHARIMNVRGAPHSLVIAHDITERKRTEAALKISETKYEVLFDAVPIGLTITDNTGKIVESNKEAERLLRMPREIQETRRIDSKEWRIIKSDGSPMASDDYAGSKALKENRLIENVEMGIVSEEGDVAWINVTATPIPIDGYGAAIAYNEITERKRLEEAQKFLLQCGLPSSGEDFFVSLAKYLAQKLGMDCVFIDQIEDATQTAKTVAVYNYGRVEANLRYALKDTPCGQVVEDGVCFFASGVCELFPRDKMLADLNAESYFGILLRDSNGQPIGLIAVIGHETLRDRKWQETLLALVAPRAAGELERRRAEEALVASEDKFRTVIHNIDVYIYILDFDDGKIVSSFHSPQCMDISGYGPEAFAENPELWLDIVHSDDRPALDDFFKENRKGKTLPPIEHRIIHKNGDVRYVLNSCTVEIASSGSVKRMEGFVIDISDRVTMEHQLREAMNGAELANKAKSEFLASMSHELRTPLNAIIGFSQILGMSEIGSLNEKQRKFIGNIRASGDHLLQMIATTLDLAKIEAGKIELQKTTFPLEKTLHELIDSMRVVAEKKSIELKLNIEPELGMLHADETRVKQILFNLLSNALKFTGAGQAVGLEARADGTRVILTVWDEGIGISPDDQTRVFFAYEQVRIRNAANQGTGLGLYITQRLVDLHGGTIKLESLPGQGSRFIVTLPGRSLGVDAEGFEVSGVIKPDCSAETFSKRVLVVEDSILNQELMKSILEIFGCTYAVAETGAAAVALALSESFDLILMDIDLPDIDGVEAMRRIRRASNTRTPIIALTAHVMEGDAEKYISAGMDGVLTKPFEIEKLKQYLMKTPANACTDAEEVTNPRIPELESVPLLYDVAEAAAKIGIPSQRLMVLVTLFLTTLTVDYSRNLADAIGSGDLPTIRSCAHKYRGAAANLRFETCSALLTVIEQAAETAKDVDYQALFGKLESELAALREEVLSI